MLHFKKKTYKFVVTKMITMKYWKILSVIFSIFFLNLSYSQFKISGEVTNPEGNPVGFASVTVYTSDNKTAGFKNTNSKGFYSIELKESGSYKLVFRNMRYSEQVETIDISPDKKEYVLNTSLGIKEKELQDVVIKGKRTDAKISGDTITYKIEHFTDKSERTLGDIINKLPGLEVDDSGNVKANGEKVDKLLVDGQEFYSDSHKVATQNLNADMVKDVQLLTDYKEHGKISSMSGDKKTALNVNLKDEYKGKITGDIQASYGHESKYGLHTNLFKFNKKGNISFIGDVQNTGNSPMDFSDYIAFLGGVSEAFSDSKSRGMRFSIDGGNSLMGLMYAGNNVISRENQMGAINIVQQLTPKFKVKFLNAFSNMNQKSFSNTDKTYLDTNSNEKYTTTENSRNLFNFSKLTMEYQPSDSTLVQSVTSFNVAHAIGDTYNDNYFTTPVNTTFQKFSDNNVSDPVVFNQKLNYQFKPSKKILITANGFFNFEKTPTNDIYFSTEKYLILPTNTENFYKTRYDSDDIKHEFGGFVSAKYNYKKVLWSLEAGIRQTNLDMNTNFFQTLSNNTTINYPDYNNSPKYRRTDVYANIGVSKTKNLFQYDIGATFKNYTIKMKDLNEKDSRFTIYPYADLTFEFSTANRLSFGYEYSENFPSIKELSDGTYINSTRSISVMNSVGLNEYFPNHTFNLNYYYFNQFSGLGVYLGGNYSIQNKSIGYDSYLNTSTLINESTAFVLDGSKSTMGYIGVNKKFDALKFKVDLRGNVNLNDGNTRINGVNSKTNSQSYSSTLGFSTLFKPAFNFEIGSRFSWTDNEVKQTNQSQSLTNIRPYAEVRGSYDMGIKWNTRLSYNHYNNNTDDLWTLNAQITYNPKDSKFEYGISGNNMLNFNAKEMVSINNSNNYFIMNTYRILPGYIMGSIKYKF